jgi:RNase P/RNase MRP subunit p30
MFYDLHLKETFKDFDELDKAGIRGGCLVHSNIADSFVSPHNRIYSRLNIDYTSSLDQATMNKYMKYNIVCISKVDNNNISSVIKLNPDIITLNLDFFKHLKKSFINKLKEKGIFIEMIIRDTLYSSKDRIIWMNCLRKLLKLGCSKNLIISSGAGIFTEIKRSEDISKLLNLFNVSDDNAVKILNNSELILRKAALKRYAYREAISNDVVVDNFKNDFIINYLKDEII